MFIISVHSGLFRVADIIIVGGIALGPLVEITVGFAAIKHE